MVGSPNRIQVLGTEGSPIDRMAKFVLTKLYRLENDIYQSFFAARAQTREDAKSRHSVQEIWFVEIRNFHLSRA